MASMSQTVTVITIFQWKDGGSKPIENYHMTGGITIQKKLQEKPNI